jgi:hypothetical protein
VTFSPRYLPLSDFTRFRIRLYRLKGSHGGEHPLQLNEVKTIKNYLRSRDDTSPILFPSNRREPISRKMLDVLFIKEVDGDSLALHAFQAFPQSISF